ncbi:hypothetical protein B0H14DRAFT_2803732 [Mycena olivaceomarginata]|nr:hypothetical protein B0H14DRAFT_2803732 [Mycena olivaceomarginata]
MATSSSNKAVDIRMGSETHLRDEYNPLVAQSVARKGLILFFLCLAQFLDMFMNSALFAAIPPISVDLNITNANSVWLISGYQLAFAALLLVSGRLSDLYNPKIVFSIGATLLTAFRGVVGLIWPDPRRPNWADDPSERPCQPLSTSLTV